MTQPSLASSFDASLIEMQINTQSFSPDETFSSTSGDTVASAPSMEETAPATGQVIAPHGKRPFRDVSTSKAYEGWASKYDTDGNILQAVDDIEIAKSLPSFLSLLPSNSEQRQRIIDLGCGTGRNTLKLLSYPWTVPTTLVGLDASQAMLAIARQKCHDFLNANPNPNIEFELELADLLHFSSDDSRPAVDVHQGKALAVISTLVLEHVPLSTFFSTVSELLRHGGVAVVTNMHPDMGSETQAGFVNEKGERVRGQSWVYGVQETVEAGRQEGLEVVGEVKEVTVTEDMLGTNGKRGQKWIGRQVWYGIIFRKM